MVFSLIAVTSLFYGCEGPAGPKGDAGADGKDGANGNSTCGECHGVSTDVLAKIIQYDASMHAIGGHFERNSTTCAPCHTHEGFVEVLETGAQATAANIDNPTPPNCRTCHMIHTNYNQDDFKLTTEASVKLWINDEVVDFGAANLCANCHQSRVVSPFPVPNGEDVQITSSRFGPHHGPQANLLAGTSGFEIPGSIAYPTGKPMHATGITNACIGCHMQTPYGTQAGGHNMSMTYNEGSPLMGACISCHTDAEDFDINGYVTEIKGLLESLKEKLTEAGIYNPETGLANSGKSYSANVAGAYLNFVTIEEDRSHGIHNPKYTKALLTNSLESLQ